MRTARLEGLDLDRVYSAHDTLLVKTCTQSCNKLLHEMEKVRRCQQMLLYCNETFANGTRFRKGKSGNLFADIK